MDVLRETFSELTLSYVCSASRWFLVCPEIPLLFRILCCEKLAIAETERWTRQTEGRDKQRQTDRDGQTDRQTDGRTDGRRTLRQGFPLLHLKNGRQKKNKKKKKQEEEEEQEKEGEKKTKEI